MRQWLRARLLLLLVSAALSPSSRAAAKTHVIVFGKWTSVAWLAGTEDRPLILKIRPLLVDARVRAFTIGTPHEVTDQLFVVQRVFRMNDSLPDESSAPPHWAWQRGGWILVDRVSGHVAQLNLPEFDAVYSSVSWFRDYAAYCGISDDGKKVSAIVAQLGRRKPVLKKQLDCGFAEDGMPNAACPSPAWQKKPARVTFELDGTAKETYAIRGHAVDLVVDTGGDEEEASK